jgi:predicted  nucleic acid-binding Zn-ribbon protein
MDERIEELISELETRRDSLRVKLDLGKKDAEDAWQDLQKDWDKLEIKLKQLGKDAVDDRDKIRADVKGLADDLAESLEKLRSRFAS